MFQTLTEKDIAEGQELMRIIEILNKPSRIAANIYLGALRDRQLIEEQDDMKAG